MSSDFWFTGYCWSYAKNIHRCTARNLVYCVWSAVLLMPLLQCTNDIVLLSLLQASALVSSQQQETALAIAGRFHGAKHALLQQLLQQSAEYRHAIAIGRMSVEMPDDQQGDEYALQARKESHLSPARPLQELLHQCFEEKAGKAIGRGSHASSSSIHDTSPYTAALRLPDVDFLSMPPVVEYTSRLVGASQSTSSGISASAAVTLCRKLLCIDLTGRQSSQEPVVLTRRN